MIGWQIGRLVGWFVGWLLGGSTLTVVTVDV